MMFTPPLHSSSEPLEMHSEEWEKMRRMTTAWHQARVIIHELWDNYYPFVIDLDNGVPTLQTLKRQKQLMAKLFTLLSPGRLHNENREIVLEHHTKLSEYFNSMVLPEGWNEYLNKLQEEYRRNSKPVCLVYDDNSNSESEDEVPFYYENDTNFMREYEDPVDVVESSDEEMSPEEYRRVEVPHLSSDSDSDDDV